MFPSKCNLCSLSFTLVQKTTTLVLIVLTCIPTFLENCSRESKCSCKQREYLEIRIRSPAYKRSFITKFPEWILSPPCKFSHSSILSIYKNKRVGDNWKPFLMIHVDIGGHPPIPFGTTPLVLLVFQFQHNLLFLAVLHVMNFRTHVEALIIQVYIGG